MKTKWNYSLTTLFLSFLMLSGFSQSFLPELGLEPKEGTIWTEKCEVPAIHDISDTLVLRGNFDGIFDNTRLIIDGQLLSPVWENRERALFLVHNVAPGKQKFTLADRRLYAEGNLQLIKVSHYFSHTGLKKGDVANLKLEIKGLDGWEQPLILRLKNHSAEEFSLSGGDQQEWAMYPGESSVKKVAVNCLERRPGPLELSVQLMEENVEATTSSEIAAKR